MVEIDKTYPIFGLWFRRYAPFKKFGQVNPYQPFGTGAFDGDNRGPSTSLEVTSRTYCAVFFNHLKIIHHLAGSSGTHYRDPILGDKVITGASNVKHKLIEHVGGPEFFSFKVSSEGNNPLVKPSPDINTIVVATVNFSGQNNLIVTGEVTGDNFPNLEVFLMCYRSSRTALLLDGRTTGWAATGPVTRLYLEGADNFLGKFNANLALDQKGELAGNSTVGSTEI